MSKKNVKKLVKDARAMIENCLNQDSGKIEGMSEVASAFVAKAAELKLDPATAMVQLVIMEKFFEEVIKDRMLKQADGTDFTEEELKALSKAVREIGQAYFEKKGVNGPPAKTETKVEKKEVTVDEDEVQGPYAFAPAKWRPNYIC